MTGKARILPLDLLAPDPGNERSNSDAEAITRLADSIRQHGILQRLLVRPTGNGYYMIVAGHRRMQAAQAAGLTQVPVEIRDIDESTARALQIVENLHREDVTPLDEAKAFDRLRGEERTIEDIADLVGHSPRYVAQRLSLINLVPPARNALRKGTIRLGTAYLLARITNAKIQREALRNVDGSEEQPLSVARARHLIEQRFEMSLAQAPFDPDDETLVKGIGSCMSCPKRAGNQPLLFADADAEARCTDPTCFWKKVKAAGRKLARELRAAGHTVHGLKASKEQFFEQGYRGYDLKKDWICPDERASYETNLTWGKVLKADLQQEDVHTYVTQPDSGLLLRVVRRSRAMKIAKAAGHAWAGARKKRDKTPAEKKVQTDQRVKHATEQRVTTALVAKLGTVTLDAHADWLVDAILDAARADSLRSVCRALELKREKETSTRYGKQKENWRERLNRARADDGVDPRMLFLLVLLHKQGWFVGSSRKSPPLRQRLIEALEIDAKSIEKQVRREESEAKKTRAAR